MFAFMKRVSRWENHMDDAMEKFIFRHQFLGFFILSIVMPLITLTAVFIGTTILTLPLALLFDWA